MSTTMRIQNKTIALSLEEKARLLQVFDIGEIGRLAVTSGSLPNTAYVVRFEPGHTKTHYCPCDARGYCSHRQAADWYLEALHRAWYIENFEIYEV